MSPPRRRSARLASGTTPKKPATSNLTSVVEDAESPERLPQLKSHSKAKGKNNAAPSSPAPAPSTPASSAMKPPHEEMHPSKAHHNMGEPSSAMRLGFTDIKDTSRPGVPPDTPSKIGAPASDFMFRFTRDTTDSTLSGDAQRLMEELRGQAAKIKADMIAKRDAESAEEDALGRKIAKPKGKTSRYSAAHMAEFKKMDSIENHASAWRAQNGRFQPVVQSLKRTPSKANLETTPTSSPDKSGLKRSPSKAELDVPTPSTPRITQSLKRKSSRANLEEYQQSPSPKKSTMPPSNIPTAIPASSKKAQLFPNVHQRVPSKRLKQRMEDDATTNRPPSRDDSSIPRPKSSGSGSTKLPASSLSLARLMSPTKASLAHTGKPTISLIKSPSKVDLKSGLPKSTSTSHLMPGKPTTPRSRVISPGRFDRVKSILRGNRTPSGNVQTAIPQPMVSQTPAPPKADKDKALPPLPLTTPRRKVTKHVAFTPEVTRIAFEQNSPSPQKSCLKTQSTRTLADEQFQGIDGTLAKADSGDVVYPDLSGFRPLPEPPSKQKDNAPASVPGKFTFRSDHTIEFGDVPVLGFGASPGQSSVRQVRQSLKPNAKMPGSFPGPTSPIGLNKENKEPGSAKILVGAPHGMSNKKRHRTSWDEEEEEQKSAERAAKKRKAEHVPEGEALLAPRLVGGTPSAKKVRFGSATPRTPASASPTKKRAVLSLSRLNMLARPKNRA
ncbi:hypothetical protein BFJ63_vAg8231 [Fusarium oxysporum f. sp. narcissi]|uniref:Erythromycin esterase n=1 Tax=Fusarium oxysporum f. sp. narcissi TaxID=451672 RepID=A0A4Q2VQL2_FUSOX|nr:hypothetical protein BFJ63_vAg8231 [Fusarium oxysporum f. sp. narcissi]